ncbi:nitrogen regulation protein NR(II) [Natrialbaceae archaeon GCM10025810]|uniref:two-component system sensor histidine kinase NtrB n=1 Tax=Halovalidus salilacus TaxID=3075124 RepID=UPI0036115A15
MYERIVEAAPTGLITLDEEGVITWTNEVFADTLEIPRAELVGTPFVDLVEAGYYDETVVETYVEAVRDLLSSTSEATERNYLVETHRLAGETRIHDVYTALLPLEDGEFRGTIHAFQDVTEQKVTERELERQNERLRSFTSVVSHDLRNPLNVAQGHLELAMETADGETRSALEEVARAHDRMETLIENLLAVAREGRSVRNPRPVDVEAVVRAAWESVETVGAELEVVDDPGTLEADPKRLQQVFENLFRNSVEHGSTNPRSHDFEDALAHRSTSHTEPVGSVDAVERGSAARSRRPGADHAETGTDRAETGTDDESASDAAITVTVGPLEGVGGVFVADDGAGIEPEARERIFDRGYTTDPDGTGFGLAIVETIVDAHGWSIEVVDGDEGARFEIETSGGGLSGSDSRREDR